MSVTEDSTLSKGIGPKARPAVGAGIGLLIGIVVVGMVVLIVQTYGIALNIKDTQARVISCTDPAGECAQRGEAATGAAVASISEASIIAAACADRPRSQTVADVERCVRAELAKRAKAGE